MKLTPSQLNELQNLAEELDGEVYEGYSGRGMFDKQCFGIKVDDVEKALYRLGKSVAVNEISFERELKSFRTDNLGYGYIIYFPRLESEEVVDGE